MNRFRTIVVGIVAIATIASVLTCVGAVDYAVGEAVWVLLPDDTPAPYEFPAVLDSEQPDPLLSLLSSRAPPASLLA